MTNLQTPNHQHEFETIEISPAEFAVIVAQNVDQIVQKWLNDIRENIYATEYKDNIYLIDHLPDVLTRFVETLKYPSQYESLLITMKNAHLHGMQRALSLDFSIEDIAKEYRILRYTLLSFLPWNQSLTKEAQDILETFIESSLLIASEELVRYLDTFSSSKDIIFKTNSDSSKVSNSSSFKLDEALNQEIYNFFIQAPSPICMLQGPEFVCTLANALYLEFVDKDILGKKLRDVWSQEEAGLFFKIIENVYETGIPFRGKELPLQKMNASGKLETQFLDVGYHAYRDEFNKIKGVLCFVQDVSSHVETRNRLKFLMKEANDQYKKFDTLLSSVSDLMSMWDRDGRYIYSNKATLQAIDLKLDDLVGKTMHEIPRIPNQMATTFDDCLQKISESKQPMTAEGLLQTPLGLREYEYQLSPIFNEKQEITGFAGASRDITVRGKVRNELQQSKAAAEQASKAKSVFLANMSHEIRTPLGAIMGFIDLMKQPNIERKEIDNYISVVDRNSHQLLRIVDDILDLSKVEAGKMDIEHIDFSIITLMADFSILMRSRAVENGLDFQLLATTALPQLITSDPTRIRQILMNVVGNAIKFTSKGNIKLQIGFKNNILELRVIDTGSGISLEQAERLFQPFTQADTSTTRKFGGTGLGLALTKRLCVAMGGDFVLEASQPGQGSTFLATLEVKLPAEVRFISGPEVNFLSEPSSIVSEHQTSLAGMKVLLVEDSPDNQNLIRILLTKAGAEVDIANNGQEGITHALSKNFDAVLMDVQMPRMDGHEATQKLRQSGYSKPVIALTAHAMKEERDRAEQSGFTDFMTKPVSRDLLIETLMHYRVTH